MPNTLGSIVVDLQANTAAFVEGMSRASSAAKKAGADISESFSRLGDLAGSALAPFGEIGRVIGDTFERIGAMGSSASQSIAKVAGGLSPLAIGAGVAGAAVAALDIAAIELTIHFAEQAAKLAVLSQQTGVSVESLSALGFVAKQSGVDQEVMTQGLTRLSKSLFKAATDAPGTANAYSRLGIAVRDSGGNVRDVGEVFGDVAEKFSHMEKGTVKTALAIQLFGRSGAQLIPVLNEGKEGIAEWTRVAQLFGIVIDEQTAEAAHKFEQTTNEMHAAAEGLGIRLMKDLLPTLQLIGDEIIKAFENNLPAMDRFVDKIAWLVKTSIAHVYEFVSILQQIGLFFDAIEVEANQLGLTMHDAIVGGMRGGMAGAVADASSGAARMQSIWKKFGDDTAALWKKNSDFVQNLTGPRAPFTPIHGRGGTSTDVDTKPEKDDTILERIKERLAALGREADEWLKIGQAGSQAEQLIAEAVKKGNDEFGKLRDLASKEKNPVRRAAALSLVDSNEGLIEGSAAAAVYGAAIKGVVSELDKQHLKLEEEVSATEALTAAWGTGEAAAAIVAAHFADQAAKVRVLKEAHDLLAAKLGEENAEVRQLAEGYALASKELKADEISYAAKVHADLNLEIKKATTAFDDELPALQAITAAYFDTAAAARAAQVELKVQQFKTANPLADEGQVNRVRDLEKQKSDQAFRNSTVEQASKFDLIQTYDLELQKLSELREALQEYGRSTLLIDAAIYDANNRMIQQWDAAVAKVGTFSQRFKGLMNELALEGQNFSGKVFDSFHKAIDDMESQLAKFVVTGKANFKQILQGLEESIVKAGIQSVVGKVAASIGLKIPGLGPKADGSENNPFHVIIAGSGGPGGGATTPGGIFGSGSAGGGIFSALSKIPVIGGIFGKLGGLFGGGELGKADGSQASPFYVISAGGDSGGGGGLLSSLLGGGDSGGDGGGIGGAIGGIASIFGGFLADGGDVTPGKAYVVGEKHPEFFVPKSAGRVAPSLKAGGDTIHHTTVNFHVHGVKDYDSFRQSQGQIYANLQQQAAIAHQRHR